MYNNLFHWCEKIINSSGTLFEGGVFIVEIVYPTEYPFKPPKYTMITKIYPNISSDGETRLAIFDKVWNPSMTTEKILLSISSILDAPIMENSVNRELTVNS
jgi:ubiquitin-conjugating enzyme E2 D/E